MQKVIVMRISLFREWSNIFYGAVFLMEHLVETSFSAYISLWCDLFIFCSRFLFPRKVTSHEDQKDVLSQIISVDGKYEQFTKVHTDVTEELKDLISSSKEYVDQEQYTFAIKSGVKCIVQVKWRRKRRRGDRGARCRVHSFFSPNNIYLTNCYEICAVPGKWAQVTVVLAFVMLLSF